MKRAGGRNFKQRLDLYTFKKRKTSSSNSDIAKDTKSLQAIGDATTTTDTTTTTTTATATTTTTATATTTTTPKSTTARATTTIPTVDDTPTNTVPEVPLGQDDLHKIALLELLAAEKFEDAFVAPMYGVRYNCGAKLSIEILVGSCGQKKKRRRRKMAPYIHWE